MFSFKIGRNGENMQLTTADIIERATEHINKKYPHLSTSSDVAASMVSITAGVAVDLQTQIEERQQGKGRLIRVPSVADALSASVEAGAEPDVLRYLISSAVLQGVLADMIVAIQEAEQDATFFGESEEDRQMLEDKFIKMQAAWTSLAHDARKAGKLREG